MPRGDGTGPLGTGVRSGKVKRKRKRRTALLIGCAHRKKNRCSNKKNRNRKV